MSEKEKESLIRTIREIEDLLKNLKREVLKKHFQTKVTSISKKRRVQ